MQPDSRSSRLPPKTKARALVDSPICLIRIHGLATHIGILHWRVEELLLDVIKFSTIHAVQQLPETLSRIPRQLPRPSQEPSEAATSFRASDGSVMRSG